MTLFFTPNEARLGSLNLSSIVPLPALPNIIAEWAGIIPLFCYLASHRDDYLTAGEVALNGRISTSLFPKLGTLSGLSRLLTRGQEFFDCANPKAGSTQIVWDVLWGSQFPCANGGASASIVRDIRRRQRPRVISTPEILPAGQSNKDGGSPTSSSASPLATPTPIQKFSESKITSWMDSIVVPHARREAWLRALALDGQLPENESLTLDPVELAQVRLSSLLAIEAGKIMNSLSAQKASKTWKLMDISSNQQYILLGIHMSKRKNGTSQHGLARVRQSPKKKKKKNKLPTCYKAITPKAAVIIG